MSLLKKYADIVTYRAEGIRDRFTDRNRPYIRRSGYKGPPSPIETAVLVGIAAVESALVFSPELLAAGLLAGGSLYSTHHTPKPAPQPCRFSALAPQIQRNGSLQFNADGTSTVRLTAADFQNRSKNLGFVKDPDALNDRAI